MLLYVHRSEVAYWGREPRTSTSTFSQLLISELYVEYILLYVHRSEMAY